MGWKVFTLTLVSGLLLASEAHLEFKRFGFFQRRDAEEMLANLRLRGDERILDVGCGDGELTALLARDVPDGHVVGIDPDSHLIAQAAEQNRFDHLDFLPESAETFETDEEFDLIVAVHSLHWVKEQWHALENFYKHLRPNGRLYLIVARSKNDLPLGQAFERTRINGSKRVYDLEADQVYLDMGTYFTILRQLGFRIDEMRLTCRESLFPTVQDMASWCRDWMPIAEETRDLFIENLMPNYLDEIGYTADWKGTVPYREYTLIIDARR